VIILYEQVYQSKISKKQVRPFQISAQVRCRGFSLGLERVMVDFGAETSYCDAVEKVREHYAIDVSESGVRVVTQKHGEQMQLESEVTPQMPEVGLKELVSEMDGTLLPIVEIGASCGDKRKQRLCKWQEAKLCLAGQANSYHRRYEATFGSVEQAARQWKSCVIRAGGGKQTSVHCVSDGARWIANQAKEQFGTKLRFLVDFYHLSEYLSAAGKAIAGTGSLVWLCKQQERMKENKVVEVLAELALHRESKEIPEENAPVRKCERYIKSRLDSLDYKTAIEKGLPIGSGEIESGHKSVLQSRLKLSGAWWKKENAEKMLALRVTRANGEWRSYWREVRQAHA
jgi:hypothetical protein